MKSFFLANSGEVYIKFSEVAAVSPQNAGKKYCVQLIGGRNFVILDQMEGKEFIQDFIPYVKNPKAAEDAGFEAP